jgi:hypothetical protein
VGRHTTSTSTCCGDDSACAWLDAAAPGEAYIATEYGLGYRLTDLRARRHGLEQLDWLAPSWSSLPTPAPDLPPSVPAFGLTFDA